MSTRRSTKRLYRGELTQLQHVELLKTVTWLPCLVMVSHYPCSLYDQALSKWRSFTFRTMTRGGRQATEKVWCNYPAPAELHDSRFLGRNRREREKLARRDRNLCRKILRLPRLERQRLIDSLLLPVRDAENGDARE